MIHDDDDVGVGSDGDKYYDDTDCSHGIII